MRVGREVLVTQKIKMNQVEMLLFGLGKLRGWNHVFEEFVLFIIIE